MNWVVKEHYVFIMSYQGKSIHFMHFNRCVFDFNLPEKNIFPSFSADDVKQSVCILQFKAKLKNNSNNALQTASCRHRNVLCSGTGPNRFGTTEASGLSHFSRQPSRKRVPLNTAVYCEVRRREGADTLGLIHTHRDAWKTSRPT